MTVTRLLHGLDRLPASLGADDARLPAVDIGTAPLRLNTMALPPEAWDGAESDHAARMAAARAWLLADCGDYNAALRRGVTRYLDAIAAHVEHHRDTLAASLARFHGLYRVEDWCWSALRPLPRAWWRRDGTWQRAELAFWNGNDVIAMRARDFEIDELPAALRFFWRDETLPVNPFRRAFPAGQDGISLTAAG